jgi:hypothetical protein
VGYIPRENEQPGPDVGGADVARSKHTPLRIEPERGQVPENGGKPSARSEAWDVLQQDDARSHLANDPHDVWPDPPLVAEPLALPGDRVRLAREARSENIHAATPRYAVEADKVRPDRSLIQVRAFHPRHEACRCIGVPLDVTNGSRPCHEPKLKPADAGAEADGT